MTTDLATQLLSARAAGDHCPSWLIGTIDLHEAHELQLAILQEKLDAGATVGGWKVGLTSEASRQKLGADERPFGFVVAERTFASGATIDSSDIQRLTIETEMCFTVGSDVAPGSVGPASILDHFSEVSAGFELNEARPGSAQADFPAMVTDCLTNWGIAYGPGVLPPSADALSAIEISLERNGEHVFSGISRDHVDDHAVSLCRLVEQLGRHDQQLRAGQKVITGAFARFETEPGDRWVAHFAGIGDAEITIE